MLRMDVCACPTGASLSDQTKAEPSYGETLPALGDGITAGLDYLYAWRLSPLLYYSA